MHSWKGLREAEAVADLDLELLKATQPEANQDREQLFRI